MNSLRATNGGVGHESYSPDMIYVPIYGDRVSHIA
jgi:hypothetical protein